MLRNFLVANAIVLACSLPLYLAMLCLEARSVTRALGFVPVPTAAQIWYDIESIYLMRVCDSVSVHFMAVPTPQALTFCIGLGLCIAALGGIWRLRRSPMMAAVLLPAVLTLPVLFGIISIETPLLMARYLLWSGPAFAILAGIGVGVALDKAPTAARHGALVAISLLLLVNLLPFYKAETKSRWDVAAQIFGAQARPQDVVYFYEDGANATMRYYLPKRLQPYLLNDDGNLQHAVQARAQGKRVWAIYGDAWSTNDWKSLADFRATLTLLGKPSAELHAGGRITMWRYDPAGK
jgi:mannosyltransferase